MQPEFAVPGAFVLAAVIAFIATPVAIRVARATSFFDLPVGYKGHRSPTPYLGGAALIAAFLAAAFAFGADVGGFGLITGLAVGMWALGTIDDRVNLPLLSRVVIEIGVGGLLWATGHGWSALDRVLGLRRDERVQPDGQHGWRRCDDGRCLGAWRWCAGAGRGTDAVGGLVLCSSRLVRRFLAA
jgi:hypothetical protein